ncbi:uncharacterized protein N7496_010749 [Penicillium cataractarum]|uniref:Uncharacterized protein n=1 Tax=Penicillium cataractarum TaxID=2100454 RepID=A0A9W9RDT9_9EURO|nr:uncharacterized protein N7496_010749 [Penicillium cataractarum]KAJ5358336.1 hypothetical protein N7496_010749 [Penicillium cataractarum]
MSHAVNVKHQLETTKRLQRSLVNPTYRAQVGLMVHEDDSLMAQANEQLERELQQSQKLTLTTYQAPRRVVSLGISPSYASANPRRKDAIIERFDLDRQSFQPFLEDHSEHLSVVVPDQPGDRKNRRALGFIQYEKEAGRITIIDPALDIASLRYHVGRDVAMVIGRTRTKPGRPVALDAFLDWLRLTTIDIRGLTYPSSLIPTQHSDLILNPQLRGQLYHNGITLTNTTVGGAFLFAYNFAYSSTYRDRRRLAS